MATASQATAQSPAGDASRGQVIEEVIVTANRREERLSDIPQAITALSSDALEKMGADTFIDYARMVPGLEFSSFSPGQTRITIRGISNELNVGGPTVSYYVDEIAITSPAQSGQPDFKLYDADRVEVLRGPQGTIYGEGSMGGTVRVITNKPDATGFAASADVTYAGVEHGASDKYASGMINVPLVRDKLALRVVGVYRREGGWIDNVQPGFEQKDTNSARTRGLRASLLFTPNDDFSALATVILNRLKVSNANIVNSGLDYVGSSLKRSSDDYDLYNLTLNYRLPFATATSATSYVKRNSAGSSNDPPATLATINAIASLVGSNPITSSTAVSSADTSGWTQEVRLVSPGDRRFRWIAGGFFRDLEQDSPATRITTPPVTFGPGNPYGQPAGTAVPGGILSSSNTIKFRDRAVFGEATYGLTKTLDATLGLRLFDETQRVMTGSSGAFVGFTNGVFAPTPFRGKNKDSGVTYRGVLTYRPTEAAMYYASISRGFRGGGTNTLNALPGIPVNYKADKTTNYELGGKLAFLDGRLQVNAALYYIDWKDFQIEAFNQIFQVAYLSNLGQAHSKGIELEAVAIPVRGLTLRASGTLQEAETDTSFAGSAGGTVKKGARLPYTSKYKYALSADYVFPPWSNGYRVVLHGDVSRVGDSYSRLQAGVNAAFGLGDNHLPAYTLANLRAGVENDRMGAYLFVDNVADKVALLADDNFGGHYRNKPRTIGINLRGRF